MPRPIAIGDLVQFTLHPCREGIVHQVAEVLDQPVGYEFADLLDVETPVRERDVAAILYR